MTEPTSLKKKTPGRVSHYDPAWCEKVIELGNQGQSFAQIARELGVSRSMLYRYIGENPAFKDAMEHARDLSLAHWETKVAAACTDRTANHNLLAFMMTNLFPADYRMRRDVSVTDNGMTPQAARQRGRSLSRDELLEMAAPVFAELDGGARIDSQHSATQIIDLVPLDEKTSS